MFVYVIVCNNVQGKWQSFLSTFTLVIFDNAIDHIQEYEYIFSTHSLTDYNQLSFLHRIRSLKKKKKSY